MWRKELLSLKPSPTRASSRMEQVSAWIFVVTRESASTSALHKWKTLHELEERIWQRQARAPVPHGQHRSHVVWRGDHEEAQNTYRPWICSSTRGCIGTKAQASKEYVSSNTIMRRKFILKTMIMPAAWLFILLNSIVILRISFFVLDKSQIESPFHLSYNLDWR